LPTALRGGTFLSGRVVSARTDGIGIAFPNIEQRDLAILERWITKTDSCGCAEGLADLQGNRAGKSTGEAL
jgi:hypothetical protein